MAIRDELGMRMKTNYENVSKTKLTRRTPVAIRIDGKAFHTFTRGFEEPYDRVLRNSMNNTMKYLCENIQGCVLGYCQSDEITLILVDYKQLNSEAWFDYQVQKMCSVAASMATMAFNREFGKQVDWYFNEAIYEVDGTSLTQHDKYVQKIGDAMFDARCFNIPKEEVANLIYWRQLDAQRNSIQQAGQTYFSASQLKGKSQNDIREMLLHHKGIDWYDYDTVFKRGACCRKVEGEGWQIDLEIPLFRGEDRQYINRLISYTE